MMFDGVVNDEFHQLIGSRNCFNGNPSFSDGFDHHHHHSYPSSAAAQGIEQLQHQHQESHVLNKSKINSTDECKGLEVMERSDWSSDEFLTMLKVRSGVENCFPEFSWQQVSRKLEEFGFRRSPDECKAKFEEESRNFNGVSYNKNYAISEFDAFYSNDNREQPHVSVNDGKNQETEESTKGTKKRKRKDKFELLKGFCEGIVKKMMDQQEALYNKMIEEMIKRDEEKIARDEAWKNQETERIKIEIETRQKEQAAAKETQAKIINSLKHFDEHFINKIQELIKSDKSASDSATSLSQILQTHPSQETHQNPSPKTPFTPSPKTSEANSSQLHLPPSNSGKRWPRDEVLALINLKCKLSDETKEGTKGPLWERISQGMSELGYKRNAKRCKEKWENINKYFRKTKDSNKKRTMDSRTCPYFHQLNCLYSEGTVGETNPPES